MNLPPSFIRVGNTKNKSIQVEFLCSSRSVTIKLFLDEFIFLGKIEFIRMSGKVLPAFGDRGS